MQLERIFQWKKESENALDRGRASIQPFLYEFSLISLSFVGLKITPNVSSHFISLFCKAIKLLFPDSFWQSVAETIIGMKLSQCVKFSALLLLCFTMYENAAKFFIHISKLIFITYSLLILISYLKEPVVSGTFLRQFQNTVLYYTLSKYRFLFLFSSSL